MVMLVQTDHSFNLLVRPVGPLQANLLPVLVRCQWCSLPDQSDYYQSDSYWSWEEGPAYYFSCWCCCSTGHDTDFEHEADPTSPAHPLEEEGMVSDQETGVLEQEPDQHLSEKQNY